LFTRTIDVSEIPDNPLDESELPQVSDANSNYSVELTEHPHVIQQRQIIDHLLEENKLLKKELADKKKK